MGLKKILNRFLVMNTASEVSGRNGILNKISPQKKFKLLGEVTMLLMQSRLHCSYFIADIYSCILPPIDLNQFRIYRDRNNYPVGFVCWAFLSQERESLYLQGKYSLKIEDWNCGDCLVFTEFIAPFGHAKKIVRDMSHNVFPHKVGKSIKVKQKKKIESVKTFYGKNVKKNFT